MHARMALLALAAIAATFIPTAPDSRQEAHGGLSAVAFLVGCWAQPGPEGDGLREFYPPPASNMLTGLSQFWRDGAIVDFEFHRIDSSADGPVLTPHPRGVASVQFRPVEIEAERIVWQNLEHDFPQRIIYHRVAPDTLVARVEGAPESGVEGLQWSMIRAACPS